MALRGPQNSNSFYTGSVAQAPAEYPEVDITATYESRGQTEERDENNNIIPYGEIITIGEDIIIGNDSGIIPEITLTFTWTDIVLDFFWTDLVITHYDYPGGVVPLDPNTGQPVRPSVVEYESDRVFSPDNGIGKIFNFVFTPKPGSAGSITFTVPEYCAASTTTSNFGPTKEAKITIYYDARIPKQTTYPDVTIEVPGEIINADSVDIQFQWTEDIKVGTFSLSNNNITTEIDVTPPGTPANFIPYNNSNLTNLQQIDNSRNYFNVTINLPVSGAGTIRITVAANSVTSAKNQLGPLVNRQNTFTYDRTLLPAEYRVTNPGVFLVCEERNISFDADKDYFKNSNNILLGGAFKGNIDIKVIEITGIKYIYLLKQIQIKDPADNDKLSSVTSARGVLIEMKIDTNDNCTIKILKHYDRILEAPQHFTVQDNKLYFFEGSHWIYSYVSRGTSPSDDWRDNVGNLVYVDPAKRSNGKPEIKTIGNVWRSKTIDPNSTNIYENSVYGKFYGASAPIRSYDNEIHIMAGFGDYREISSYNVPTNKSPGLPITDIENVQWIKFSKSLNTRITKLETNDKTGWQILLELANLTASYIGFKDGKFFIVPRYSRKADLNEDVTEDATDIIIKNWNREFPDSGYLLVGEELIKYDGGINNINISPGVETIMILNVKRGVEHTNAVTHDENDMVYHIDHVISSRYVVNPIEDLVLTQDSNQLYNQVKITYGQDADTPPPPYEDEDRESVVTHGGFLAEFDLPLDRHQTEWVKWIADTYLELFKDIHYITDITLDLSLYFRIGDVIMIKDGTGIYENIRFQVLRISHDIPNEQTILQIRTL